MKIYDFSKNGFVFGEMYVFLHKLGCIKKPESYIKATDPRGYFIGYADDDND